MQVCGMMSSPSCEWQLKKYFWCLGRQSPGTCKFRQIYAKAMRLVKINADLRWSHADLSRFINILTHICKCTTLTSSESCGAGPGFLHVNLCKSTFTLSQFTQLYLQLSSFVTWTNLWKFMQMNTNDVISLGRWNLATCSSRKSKPTWAPLWKFMQICTHLCTF